MSTLIRPYLAQNPYGLPGRQEQFKADQNNPLSRPKNPSTPVEDSIKDLNSPEDNEKQLLDAISSILQTGQALDSKAIKSLSSQFGIPPEQILQTIRSLGRTVEDEQPRESRPASQVNRNLPRPEQKTPQTGPFTQPNKTPTSLKKPALQDKVSDPSGARRPAPLQTVA